MMVVEGRGGAKPSGESGEGCAQWRLGSVWRSMRDRRGKSGKMGSQGKGGLKVEGKRRMYGKN